MFSNQPDIRPKVFLGYTTKANKLITAIEENFREEDFPVELLPFDLLDLSERSVKQFNNEIKSCDFAMFVFGSKWSQNLNGRTIEYAQHIALKLGMCFNELGTDRVFHALPQGMKDPFLLSFEEVASSLYKENEIQQKRALKTFCNKSLKLMDEIGPKDKTIFKEDPKEITDLVTHYSIRIINKEGDAVVSRRVLFEANKDQVDSREHWFFSDTSTSTYNDCNIIAKDSKDRDLFVEKVYDAPNKKEFRVLFRRQLSMGERLEYTYSFFWSKMFPPNSSKFTLKSTANKILFDLVISNKWDLLHIKPISKPLNGISHQDRIMMIEKGKSLEGEFLKYSYELREFDNKTMETQMSWKLKYL